MKKDELLVPRLDLLIPCGLWELPHYRHNKASVLGRVVEINPAWVIEVVNNNEHRMEDVLHDFRGIYAEDEHFVPRISTEKEYTRDEVWDNIIEYGIATKDELTLVCLINGNKIESLNDVLKVRTSYKDWNQYKSMEG